MKKPMHRELVIYRVSWLEADVIDGDRTADETVTERYYDLSAADTAALITREGLSFAASGNDWASNPDGSRITDYATGERTEVTAHLHGYLPRLHNAIMEKVG